MKEHEIEEMLKTLKDRYEQMPPQTSVDEIMLNVKKEKRSARKSGLFFRKWQAVAVIILAVGITSIFMMNQSDELSTSPFMSSDFDESGEIIEPKVAFDLPTEESEEEETEAIEESEDHSTNDDNEQIFSKIETVIINGQEEIIELQTIDEDAFPFVSKVDKRYGVEIQSLLEQDSLSIFTNESNGRPFFTVIKYKEDISLNNLLKNIKEQYHALGYEEDHNDRSMTEYETDLSFEDELGFHKEDSFINIGIVESDHVFYSVIIHSDGEVNEWTEANVTILLKNALIKDDDRVT